MKSPALRKLKTRIRHAIIRSKKPSSRSLTELADLYRTDKGHHWFERHGYTDVYQELFQPLKDRELRLLEIGLRFDPYYAEVERVSPSLSVWSDFFPNAEIIGFDINDFTALTGGRVRVFQGDQGNDSDLSRLAEEAGPFDIIIDDGSHASWHQQTSLRALFPHLRQGGIYIVEDLHYQPPPLEEALPATVKTRDYLRSSQCADELGVDLSAITLEKSGKLGILRKSL